MTARRGRRALTGAVVVATLLLGGCAASGDQGETSPTTTTTAGSTTSDDPSLAGATIAWEECGGGFECGTLAVPLDYEEPGGATIELGVTRHRAEDPSARIGALLVNPGGPGASAIELARSLPRGGELGDRFDIVGFDPRGVGESSALDCHSHLQEIYDADPTIDSDADRTELLDTSQAFVDECEAAYGDELPFLGTTNVARDMDEVRKALGEEQISYLGYSYGTSLGQEYARLFPTRVRAMILDGVVDHEPDGLTTAEQQAAGFETAFDSYVAHCEEDGCGFGDQRADAVVDEVIAAAEEAPIPAPDADRPASPGVVSVALAQALYSEFLWGQLSNALRDAQDGDGSGLVDLADQYLGRGDDGEYEGGFEIYFAVSCLDDTWPKDPQDIIDASNAAEAETPRFGGAIVTDYVRCALWPAEQQPLDPVPADTEGLPPILVISTTNDPATPYENGVHVAQQIPGAVLLTNEGEGHTIALQGKPCVDDAAMAYLTELEVPDEGTTCSA
ncbi:MAG TPA: alpha/beta hydrolase [Aquihabitans sp.]|nr:alpha/beta hydrolase [Aquihabitans sp.]